MMAMIKMMESSSGMEILSPASYIRESSWLFDESRRVKWTAEENKRFENALALFDKDTPDRWYSVASLLPGKTVNDVIKQYNELVADVSDIEAGLFPHSSILAHQNSIRDFTLDWVTTTTTTATTTDHHQEDIFDHHNGLIKQLYGHGVKRAGSSTRSSDHERKKGIPWTEEEHRQFLLGLKKYGKGDWRNISRNFVTTRTPTQVASHAQKYFIRQVSGGKDKRRSSIHDITTVSIDEEDTTQSTTCSLPEKNKASLQDSSPIAAILKTSPPYNYTTLHQNQTPDGAATANTIIRSPNNSNLMMMMNKTHLYYGSSSSNNNNTANTGIFEPFQGMNSSQGVLQLGYNMYFQM